MTDAKKRRKQKVLPKSKVKRNRGIPFSEEQWAEIEAGAEAACLPKAVFVRQAAIHASRKVLSGDPE